MSEAQFPIADIEIGHRFRPISELRPHPAHEHVPLAHGEDLRALRDSLAENGQQDPIDITPDGVILDGRTRWTLLTQQGVLEVRVRVQDIPDSQQVAWIVDRAVARRHLSMEQKRALNEVLRSLVVATDTDPRTGEERRMGMGQTQRAEKLGVSRAAVQEWDRAPDGGNPPSGPTHQLIHDERSPGGRIEPLRKPKPAEPKPESRTARARKAAPSRFGTFTYMAAFTRWARKALPEQRKHLVHIRDEADRAIALIDGERNEASSD